MSKNTFNLGDYLKDSAVSKADTAQEQIEYVPLEDIDPDPDNFYSLEGLDELAGNIELVGLQQPLRVRENPSAADGGTSPSRGGRRFTVVSGHRRRAACLMISNGGNDMFRDGVPCIVERGEASPEMRELRLIYANSATRVMTSAELSKQAARVEELLYALKKQGVEFPGRMRDHVAAAVNASKTKLARLHAIRGKLVPPLLKMFDAGEINESVAYRISQEEPKVQTKILEDQGAVLRHLTADGISSYVAQLRFMQNRKPEPVGAAISRPQKDDNGPMRVSAPTEAAGTPSGAARQLPQGGSQGTENDGRSRTPAPMEAAGTPSGAARQLPQGGSQGTEDDGRSRTPAPTEIIPTWMSGTPPRDGRYLCTLAYTNSGTIQEVKMDYKKRPEGDATSPWLFFGSPLSYAQVIGWWPLPDKEGA